MTTEGGIILGSWIISWVAGFLIGESKGRSSEGITLGIIFGPLGVLMIAAYSDKLQAQREQQMLEELRGLRKILEGASITGSSNPEPTETTEEALTKLLEKPKAPKAQNPIEEFVPENLQK